MLSTRAYLLLLALTVLFPSPTTACIQFSLSWPLPSGYWLGSFYDQNNLLCAQPGAGVYNSGSDTVATLYCNAVTNLSLNVETGFVTYRYWSDLSSTVLHDFSFQATKTAGAVGATGTAMMVTWTGSSFC